MKDKSKKNEEDFTVLLATYRKIIIYQIFDCSVHKKKKEQIMTGKRNNEDNIIFTLFHLAHTT